MIDQDVIEEYKDNPSIYVLYSLLDLFKFLKIELRPNYRSTDTIDNRTFHISNMNGDAYKTEDLYKFMFHTKYKLSNYNLFEINKFLSENFDMNNKDCYFTDQSSWGKDGRFIIQVAIRNFYRNLSIRKILC
jgi:hypothetical protein